MRSRSRPRPQVGVSYEVRMKFVRTKTVCCAAEEKAASKREKEKMRSALKKARKVLKALGEPGGAWAARVAELDVIATVLPIDELCALTATLSADTGADAADALAAAHARAMAQ